MPRVIPGPSTLLISLAACAAPAPGGTDAADGWSTAATTTGSSGAPPGTGVATEATSDPGGSAGGSTGGSSGAADSSDGGAAPSAPFSFLVYGDSRSGGGCEGNAAHLGVVDRLLAEPDWEFVVHLGDMTTGYDASTCFAHEGDCSDPNAHGNFSLQIAPLLAKRAPAGLPSAFIPVVGNHDDNVDWVPDACGDRMCDVFDLGALLDHPTPNGEPCGADFPQNIYYAFRHRGVLFVALRVNDDDHDLFECNGFEDGYSDCADYCANAPASPTRSDLCYNVHQYDWLRETLAAADGDPTVTARVVMLHAPLYTSYDDHAPTSSFGALVPLLEQHDVDFVFSGHNHTYERTVPIRAGAEASDGVVYVTTGHGGSEGGAPQGAWFTAGSSGAYHFVRIDVDDAGLHGTAIDIDGNVIDEF